jgi:hypothetical protein
LRRELRLEILWLAAVACLADSLIQKFDNPLGQYHEFLWVLLIRSLRTHPLPLFRIVWHGSPERSHSWGKLPKTGSGMFKELAQISPLVGSPAY